MAMETAHIVPLAGEKPAQFAERFGREYIEGGVCHLCTVSALQMHPRGIIVCDDAATDEMKVGTVNYFKDIEKANL